MGRSTLLVFILPILIFTACHPKNRGPDIQSIVATSLVGTSQAQRIETIVSATNAALAAKKATQEPPERSALPGIATQASNTASPPTATGCRAAENGKLSYTDTQAGYCLLYPDYFFVNKPGSGTVQFLGPLLNKNDPPVRAIIEISKNGPVGGRTLDEIATSLWRTSRSNYQVSNINLGGRDALVAENLIVGDTNVKTRQVFFTNNKTVYLITFAPVDQAGPFAKALPDVQTFWDAAIPSFTFINP